MEEEKEKREERKEGRDGGRKRIGKERGKLGPWS